MYASEPLIIVTDITIAEVTTTGYHHCHATATSITTTATRITTTATTNTTECYGLLLQKGRVVKLQLHNNELEGTLHASLGQLSGIRNQ